MEKTGLKRCGKHNRIIKNTRLPVLWVLTLVCLAGIIFLSSQSLEQSTALSRGVTQAGSRLVSGGSTAASTQPADGTSTPAAPAVPAKPPGLTEKTIRELAHVFIFMLLSLFVNLLIREYGVKRWYAAGFSVCVAYTFIDELFQQLLSRGRAFELEDIYRDILGCAIGLLLAAGAAWCISKRAAAASTAGEWAEKGAVTRF